MTVWGWSGLLESIMLVLFHHSPSATLRIGLLSLGLLGLTGCQPAGPQALLEGERLIHEGQFEKAVDRLRSATELLPNHAQSWNHLGLALHGLGKSDEAFAAYQHALRLDKNLGAAHYNLGLILLENNRAAEAALELGTFTSLMPTSTDGWSRLGIAFLRQRKWDDAERAFGNAHRLEPKNPETLNNLGVVVLQKRKTQAAAQWFNQALGVQPDYAPALLNLAIVSHHYFNAKPLALEHYRHYVRVLPESAQVAAVRETIQRLEIELQPKPAPPSPPISIAVTNPPTITVITNKPAVVVGPAPVVPKPVEAPVKVITNIPVAVVIRTNATALVKPEVKPAPATNPAPQLVVAALAPKQPVLPPLVTTPVREEVTPVPPVATAPTNAPPRGEPIAPLIRSAQREPAKDAPSFWQRSNPIRWFSQKIKGSDPVAAPQEQATATAPPVVQSSTPPPLQPKIILRYPFGVNTTLEPGNRAAAEPFFLKGLTAHQAQRFGEAVAGYQQALLQDPSYFEAVYNLGLAGYQTRAWPLALSSGERAVKLNPASIDARYNFALTLEAAGYFLDAVEQLELGLQSAPQEPRLHLAVAAIYSEHLSRPAQARDHYRSVLAVEPNHPKAESIRRWLGANP